MKTISTYQDFLDHVPILPQSKPDKTLMSIAGVDHLENVWSRIYAYFLDERESHGLNYIFKHSLENIIYKKTRRQVDLSGGIVECERKTSEGNRIDILIQAPNHSVIIENKIYHTLNNDLDDYWKSVEGNAGSKTGIVLTLTNILTNNLNFINITHLEWIVEIEKLLSQNHSTIKDLTSTLLNDFISTVKQVSGNMNKMNLDFYLANRVKINNLSITSHEYRDWLQQIFTNRAFIQSLGPFSLVHNDWAGCKHRFAMYRLNLTDEKDELVVTVFYESLWNSKPGEARLSLFLEPLGDLKRRALLKECEINEKADTAGVPSDERGVNKHKDFWHCARVDIDIPESELLDACALKRHLQAHLMDFNPDKGLMAVAREIMVLLSVRHQPTYQWDDAMKHLKNNITKNQIEIVELLEFVLYDAQRNIVLLDVVDSFLRDRIEFELHNQISNAIGYAFGEGSRFAIMYRCRLD